MQRRERGPKFLSQRCSLGITFQAKDLELDRYHDQYHDQYHDRYRDRHGMVAVEAEAGARGEEQWCRGP
jgi:hypothetical protein